MQRGVSLRRCNAAARFASRNGEHGAVDDVDVDARRRPRSQAEGRFVLRMTLEFKKYSGSLDWPEM
jgi:hypothetical protein